MSFSIAICVLFQFLIRFILFSYRTGLVTRFGVILNDETTIKVNLFGVMLNIAYICYFYIYTNNVKEKTLVWAQMGYAGAFLAALYAYTVFEYPENLPFRFGMILTAVLFYFVGSPLLGLVSSLIICFKIFITFSNYRNLFNKQGEIIRKKSTEGMPFPIIMSGSIISFLWLLYGIVMREGFVVFQNVVILLMSAVQLSLFAIFPSAPQVSNGKTGSPKASNNHNNNNNKKKN